MDNIASTDWDLDLYGGTGNDRLSGGIGNDRIFGGAGADHADGGSGSDRVNTGSGDDILMHRLGVNAAPGTQDIYTGGSGRDTLLLEFTRAEWLAWQVPLARYVAHLALVTNPKTGEVSNGSASDFVLQFGDSALLVQMIEAVRVSVDGVELTAQDDPVTAVADGASTGEEAAVSVAVLANDTVPDLVRSVSVGIASQGTVALQTPDANDPSTWSVLYTPDPLAFQQLAVGESATDSFTYLVIDADGDDGSAQVTITIQGENDPVGISTPPTTAAVVEDADGTADPDDASIRAGSITFTDVDLSDTHSAVFLAAAANGTTLGTFSLDTVAEAPGAAGGSVDWHYTLDTAAAQYLAVGETVVETYEITVEDGHGGAATHPVTISITGTNDPTAISLLEGDGNQAALTETDGGLFANGRLTVRDPDVADGIASAVTGVTTEGPRGGLTDATLLGFLQLAPLTGLAADPDDSGNLAWMFDSGEQTFDFLASGQTLSLRYTLQAEDGHGGSDTETVTITISGTADGPSDIVLAGMSPGGNNMPNVAMGQFAAVSATGAVQFTATLAEKTLSGTAVTDTTPDLVVSTTGLLSPASGPTGMEEGRVYELMVTATDAGGSLQRLFRIVTGSTSGDVITLGSTINDLAFLGGGQDTIHAGAGDDTVYGQNGDDHIHGQAGNDDLYGMNGADTFYFDTPLDPATNLDRIHDFNAGNANTRVDTIWLSAAYFTGLVSSSGPLAAQDFQQVSSVNGSLDAVTVGATVNIVHDVVTGALYHDPDGGALDNAVQFAVLVGLSGTLNHLDFQAG